MQSTSVFLDIAKFADFRMEIFGSSSGKVKLCQVSSLYDMCNRF